MHIDVYRRYSDVRFACERKIQCELLTFSGATIASDDDDGGGDGGGCRLLRERDRERQTD